MLTATQHLTIWKIHNRNVRQNMWDEKSQRSKEPVASMVLKKQMETRHEARYGARESERERVKCSENRNQINDPLKSWQWKNIIHGSNTLKMFEVASTPCVSH